MKLREALEILDEAGIEVVNEGLFGLFSSFNAKKAYDGATNLLDLKSHVDKSSTREVHRYLSYGDLYSYLIGLKKSYEKGDLEKMKQIYENMLKKKQFEVDSDDLHEFTGRENYFDSHGISMRIKRYPTNNEPTMVWLIVKKLV